MQTEVSAYKGTGLGVLGLALGSSIPPDSLAFSSETFTTMGAAVHSVVIIIK